VERITRAVAVLAGSLALAGAAALVPGPARAEHEVYYRYTVLGYVKDAQGRPVAARRVEVIRDKTGLAYRATTDAKGFFGIVLRIGDESAGERLTLRVGGAAVALVARFDPANHSDERGTRVDLEGARFVERPSWFRPTLANLLGPGQR
jgi:hypothetical protein